MQFALRTFLFSLFAVPAILFAQAAYTGPTYSDGSPKCSIDKSETITIEATQENATGAIMGKNDKCVSETVSISADGKITFAAASSTRAKISTACSKRDNCVPMNCGILTIKLLGGKTISVNKCDPDAKKKIEAAVGAGGLKTHAFQAVTNTAVDRLNFKNEADRTQTEQVLKSFGVPEEQAKTMIANKPEETKDLLRAFAAGDKEKIETAATNAGVTLNSDVVNKAVSMSDMSRTNSMSAIFDANEKRMFGATVTGLDTGQGTGVMAGVTDMDRAKCAISKIESGSCGGNYGTVGPLTKKGQRAYGRYQVMDFNIPSWTRGACGQSLTPGQYLADGECQEKVFEKYFMSGVQKCGSYEGAALRWFSGKCYDTGGNDGWTSTTKYLQKFSSTFGNDTMPFGAQARPYLGGGSPFAQVNPTYGLYTTTGTIGYPTSYGSPMAGYTPVMNPTTISSGAVPPTGVTPTQTAPVAQTPPPPPPAASIITQPKDPLKGDPITISWSTVGMKTDALCQVTVGGGFFAQGNEGTRVFQTKTLNASTTVLFELKCTSLSGQVVQKQASVLLK